VQAKKFSTLENS